MWTAPWYLSGDTVHVVSIGTVSLEIAVLQVALNNNSSVELHTAVLVAVQDSSKISELDSTPLEVILE